MVLMNAANTIKFAAFFTFALFLLLALVRLLADSPLANNLEFWCVKIADLVVAMNDNYIMEVNDMQHASCVLMRIFVQSVHFHCSYDALKIWSIIFFYYKSIQCTRSSRRKFPCFLCRFFFVAEERQSAKTDETWMDEARTHKIATI